MNILEISKPKREVTVTLSSDELVKLCNIMYESQKPKNSMCERLYSDLILARDLSQYGLVDNFSLSRIVEHRNNCDNPVEGILSKEDIDTFNSYIENNDMPTAFGNSDFSNIYRKIVGNSRSEKIKQWIENKNN